MTTGSNSNGYRTASGEEQENYFICGEWVVVSYEGKQYPGTIVQVHAHDKIEVSVMIQAGVQIISSGLNDMTPSATDDKILLRNFHLQML